MIGEVAASSRSSPSRWMPAFASANSGTITKLVQGWSRYWSRSFAEIADATLSCAERASSGVGCSRKERRDSVTRSRSVRTGGYALVTRPTASPVMTGSMPDSKSATHIATPRSAGGRPAPFDRRVPEGDQPAEEADGDGERKEREMVRVHRGDDEQRHEVVEDRERQQADAQARAAGSDQREHAEREGGVGRHGGSPALRPVAAGVEGQEDQDRQRHASHRRDQRDRDAPPLAQLPHVELALGLEPEDQEEERHQALVDPDAAGPRRCRRRRSGSRGWSSRPTRRSPTRASSPRGGRRWRRGGGPRRRRSPC